MRRATPDTIDLRQVRPGSLVLPRFTNSTAVHLVRLRDGTGWWVQGDNLTRRSGRGSLWKETVGSLPWLACGVLTELSATTAVDVAQRRETALIQWLGELVDI